MVNVNILYWTVCGLRFDQFYASLSLVTGLNLNQGNIIHILFAIIGLLIGLALERNGGWAYGLLSGLALGLWIRANTQIIKLQKELSTLSGHFYDLSKFIEKTQGVFKDEPAEHRAPRRIKKIH